MRPVRLVRLLAALALAALVAAGAGRAQDLSSTLTASVSLRDLVGAPLREPLAGAPFRIDVALEDAALRAPPRGVLLQAWIRRIDAASMSCHDAARAFRATRAISAGSYDLNGFLLAQLNRDGSFGVIDPKLNLRSSNMISATRFAALPAGFAVDRVSKQAFFTFSNDGRLVAVNLLDGAQHVIAEGLDRPGAVAVTAAGHLWVAEAGRVLRFGPKGERLGEIEVGRGEVSFSEGDPDRLLAYSAEGGLALIGASSGAAEARIEGGGPLASALLAPGGGVVTLDADGVTARLRFADAPGETQEIALAGPATRLGLDARGGYVFAYSDRGEVLSVIDVATARVVRSVGLEAPVSDMAATEEAVYFMLADHSAVLALDPRGIAHEAPLDFRRIATGQPTGAPLPSRGLLVPLPPSPKVLAVNAASATGFVLHEVMALGNVPPMDSVRMNGGAPLAVRMVDQSLRETAPGRFEAHARLDAAGAHELVLTTGVGGMTVCIPISVEGPPDASGEPLRLALRVSPEAGALRAGTRQILTLDFVDADGAAYSADRLELMASGMSFNWAARLSADRDAEGRLRAAITLPAAGTYALTPLLGGEAAAVAIAPAILEVGL